MEDRRFTCVELFVTVVSLLTLLVDVGTDVLVITQFYERGDSIWGSLMLAFTVVPLVVMNVFSLKWYITDAPLTPFNVLLHLFLIAPIHRYARVLRLGFRSWMTGKHHVTEEALHEQNDVAILRLFETFLEAAPQLVIQLHVMLQQSTDVEWFQGLSAGCSLLSLAWALTAYNDALRLAFQTSYRRRFISLALHCAWRLFMVSARVAAFVVFASYFHAWLLLVAGVHWCAMTAYIWWQGADFGRGKVEQALFRIVSGFIYIFVFLNIYDGPTRLRILSFYIVMGVENAALLLLGLVLGQLSNALVAAFSIVVSFGLLLGTLCMMAYYRWFHPSGPINFCTVTVTLPLHMRPQSSQEGESQGQGHSPAHLSVENDPLQLPTTPAKQEEGGNLTLSYLLDSASKGELQWQPGLNTNNSDISSILSEDCRSSSSFSASSSDLTGKGHSERSPSPSGSSMTFTSDQGYNSSPQQDSQSPQSQGHQSSVWCTESSWSNPSCIGGEQDGGCGQGRGGKAEPGGQGQQTDRELKDSAPCRRDPRETSRGREGRRCSHCGCSISLCSEQSLMFESDCSATPTALHPHCCHRCPTSHDTTLSSLNINQLWRESVRRVISSTVMEVFPALNNTGSSQSSKCLDSSQQEYKFRSSPGERDVSLRTQVEKSWPEVRAPLAQPESSDLGGRSSPSLCSSRDPSSPHFPLSQSAPSDLATSTPFPHPSRSGQPIGPDVLRSSRPSKMFGPRHQTKGGLFPPLDPDHCLRSGVLDEAKVCAMLDQLKRTSGSSVLSRCRQLSPLRTDCLDTSPQRLGRNVDLFDSQAWRRWLGWPPSETLRCEFSMEEEGTEAMFDDGPGSDSDHSSQHEQSRHRGMPSAKDCREGLYRYFMNLESPVHHLGGGIHSSSQPDVSHLSPAVQGEQSTLLNSSSLSHHGPGLPDDPEAGPGLGGLSRSRCLFI